MKDVCKEKWDADFIDKIGENRQQLYDLILVRHTIHSSRLFPPARPMPERL
jgi:hypothetical protein